MNWEAIGAVGEVVGAVGVVATLVYLAAQIRQNSNVVRSSTRQAVSTVQMEIGLRIATDPQLTAAVARSLLGTDAATDAQIVQLRGDMFLRSLLRVFENQYHQNKDGTFEDAMWSGYLENMRRIFHAPGFPIFWEAHRELYSTDFAAFVDAQR